MLWGRSEPFENRLPHRWLMGFAFTHGLNEWLDLWAFSISDNAGFQWVRLFVLVGSFACLLEFGRRGWRLQTARAPGAWIHLAAAGLVLFAGMLAPETGIGFNVAIRYFYGLPAAGLAGWAIWLVAFTKPARERWPLLIAASAFLIYALAAGLIVPRTRLLLAGWVNQEAFSAAFHFPVQLLRAFCAIGVAFTLGLIHYKDGSPTVLTRGPTQWVAGGLLIFILSTGYWIAGWRGNQEFQDAARRLSEISVAVARTIDGQMLNDLDFNRGGNTNQAWVHLQSGLSAYASTVPIQGIITIRLREGRYYFGPNSGGNWRAIRGGQVYSQPPIELAQAFRTRETIVAGPYRDEYGEYVTSFAPVINVRTGEADMVVGVDASAKEVTAAVRVARVKQIGFTWFLSLYVMVAEAFLKWRRRKPRGPAVRVFSLESGLALGIGLIVTLQVTHLVRANEWRTRELDFSRLAAAQALGVFDKMAHVRMHILASLSRWFELDESVSREKFRQLAAPLANKYSIAGLGWAPRVPAAKREAFESALRQEGLASTQIFQLNPQGQRESASPREAYFPLAYVEPQREIESAIGFDIASESNRWTAAQAAMQSRQLAASGLIHPVNIPADEAINIYAPAWRIPSLPFRGVADESNLRGFLYVTLRLDDLLKETRLGIAAVEAQIQLNLFRLEAGRAPQLLAAYPAPGTMGLPAVPAVNSRWVRAVPIFEFGGAYVLLQTPEKGPPGWRQMRAAWISLAVGAVLSLGFALFVSTLVRRHQKLDGLVRARTQALESANLQLTETLKVLRQFSRVVEQTGSAIVITDAKGAITFVNKAFCDVSGFLETEVIGQNPRVLKSGVMNPQLYRDLWETITQGKAWRGELCNRNKNRELFWELAVISPLLDEAGKLAHFIAVKENITERKLAERAAFEWSQRLHKIAARVPGLVCQFVRQRNGAMSMPYANGALLEMLEMAPSDIARDFKKIMGMIHPEDREPLLESIQVSARNLTLWQADFRVITANGSQRWLHGNAAPEPGEAGSILWYGFIHEITERKSAETTLRRKAGLDRALSEVSLGLLNIGGDLEPMANLVLQHCRALTGSELGCVVSVDVMSGMAKVLAAGIPRESGPITCWPEEHRAIPFDRATRQYGGMLGYGLNSRQPLVVDCGLDLGGLNQWLEQYPVFSNVMLLPVVVGQDMLGLIALANAPHGYSSEDLEFARQLGHLWGLCLLKIGERKFRTVADWGYDWDMWTDETQQLLYISPSVERITGYAPSEFFADSSLLERLIHADDRDLCQRHFMEAAGNNLEVLQLEFRILNRHGEARWIQQISGPVFSPDGLFIGRRSSNRDITERKHAEAEREKLQSQLLQAQKMESIGQLAGGVAHDFNNILAAILMHIDLMRSDQRLDVSMIDGLQELEREAQRAASLTRQLLLFSRRQVLEPRKLDLRETIGGMIKMLRRLLGEHIEIKVDHPAESVWVEADPGMMEQVVMNLCVNARDAMPKGGRLNIQLRAIALEPEAAQRQPSARPGQFIRLQVADSGCGMDEATLKRIFEPFFTTKEAGKGTGLGLATVYGIVKQHQGWIEVESAVGQGTAFQIYIPASEAAEANAETATAPVVKGGRETILLAEDDESVRRLMAASLRRQGYRLIEARHGLEALALWEEHHGRIDLVISDMMMPQGMTGLDLAENLRAHRPGLPVVISSGYSADLAGTDASQLEGIAFLPKPCPPATLVQTVRQCLDRAADPSNSS